VLRRVELPAFLRGEGVGGVRHQCTLLRSDLSDEVEKAAIGIAFDVELETRPPRPHQLGEAENVSAADMPLVGSRMRRQPVGAGIVRDPAKAAYVRNTGTPRIAQQGDLVEIDAETGHSGEIIPSAPPRSAFYLGRR